MTNLNCENKPMHLEMHRALRCHAKSKRSGLPCRAPAARGTEVCRMHGAGGGARKGNKKAVKNGAMVAESLRLEGRFKPSRGRLARRLRQLDRVVAEPQESTQSGRLAEASGALRNCPRPIANPKTAL